jgi:hypothetical protein
MELLRGAFSQDDAVVTRNYASWKEALEAAAIST